MATSAENYNRGIESLRAAEQMHPKVLKLRNHTTSNSLVLAIGRVELEHFNDGVTKVSEALVRALATDLSYVWNKKNRHGYISGKTLEKQLNITPKTRKFATRVLRATGFFGVIEGFQTADDEPNSTNLYFPLFDSGSRELFERRITEEYEIWEATQPQIQSDETPHLQEGDESTVPF